MNTCTNPIAPTAGHGVLAGPPLAVWACGQHSLAAQLTGTYLPATAGHHRLLTPELARHLSVAFTGPGDLVIDPSAGPGVLLAEAAAAGRRSLGLITSDQEAELARDNLARALTPGQQRQARIRRGDEQHPAACLGQHHGQAQLVATRLAGPATTGEHPRGGLGDLRGAAYENALASLLAGWAVLAKPGGTVAVVTTSPVTGGILTDLPGLVIRLAARTGLAYTQHIIAITAMIRDSRLIPWPADSLLAPPGDPRDHDDILIFTRTPPGASSAKQEAQ